MAFAYRAIIPRELLVDPHRLKAAMKNTLKQVAMASKVDFQVTTQTWQHQPKFETKIGPFGAAVYTTDQRYQWINNGTDPYTIRPRRASALRFNVPFRAKTRPGKIRSGKGSRGKRVVYAKVVHHPGITARNFDIVIWQKWQKEFPVLMQQAFDAAVGK